MRIGVAALAAALALPGCGGGDSAADECADVQAVQSELQAEFAAIPSIPPKIRAGGPDDFNAAVQRGRERRALEAEQVRVAEQYRTLIRQNPDCLSVAM